MKGAGATTKRAGSAAPIAPDASAPGMQGLQDALAGLDARLLMVDEKVSLLLAQGGFYSPAQVRELSTLSDTEIARRQAAGTFPPYVELGPMRRGLPRAWFQRWTFLLARGREWSPADSAGIQAVPPPEEDEASEPGSAVSP